jgi:hypothetical protein
VNATRGETITISFSIRASAASQTNSQKRIIGTYLIAEEKIFFRQLASYGFGFGFEQNAVESQ